MRRVAVHTIWLLLASVAPAEAANHYIRAGAGGTADGSDWTNAWTSIPAMASITRGDTYYIADGNYVQAGATTFDKAADGVQIITIKKATAADHGTDVGWNAAYGDGQAIFGATGTANPAWIVTSDYWTFDGAVGGGPGHWDDTCGFAIVNVGAIEKGNLMAIGQTGVYAPHDVNVRHVYFDIAYGIDNSFSPRSINMTMAESSPNPYSGDSMKSALPYDQGPNDVTISYCVFSERQCETINITWCSHITFEYNYWKGGFSDVDHHGCSIQSYGSRDITVRYNWLRNQAGTAQFDMKTAFFWPAENWKVYGNVFWWEDAWLNDAANAQGIGPVYGGSGNYCGDMSATVTAATKANPCQITLSAWPTEPGQSAAQCLADGFVVGIYGVGGMTQLNENKYTVANCNSGAKTLTLNVDSSAFGEFTTGGTLWVDEYKPAHIDGLRFYNNTIVNFAVKDTGKYYAGIETYDGNDNYVRNNLWYHCDRVWMQSCGWRTDRTTYWYPPDDPNHLSWGYGMYATTTLTNTDANATDIVKLAATGNPITDWAAHDFTLNIGTNAGAAAQDAGEALAAEYNTDMMGNTRGADGHWDIGALEYQGEVAAPDEPNTPNPATTATGVSITADLSWAATGGATTYDVNFSTANPPVTKVSTGQAGVTYDPGTLAYSTTYYWQILAEGAGGSTEGPVWSFTTEAAPAKYALWRHP